MKFSKLLSLTLSLSLILSTNVLAQDLNITTINDTDVYAVAPPTQLAPREFNGNHDGTRNFSYSPYYFSPHRSEIIGSGAAAVNVEAKTNFRMEFYSLNHDYLFHTDATRYQAPNGEVTYLTIHRFSNDFPDFYYIMVNMHGVNTQIQGSSVWIQHNGY